MAALSQRFKFVVKQVDRSLENLMAGLVAAVEADTKGKLSIKLSKMSLMQTVMKNDLLLEITLVFYHKKQNKSTIRFSGQ